MLKIILVPITQSLLRQGGQEYLILAKDIDVRNGNSALGLHHLSTIPSSFDSGMCSLERR
jgi:hypothetical protein